MQLRFKRKTEIGIVNRGFLIKVTLFVLLFFLAIFFLDKINIEPQKEIIKKEISNDKLTTLK